MKELIVKNLVGETNVFEIVESIPKGYMLWNIGSNMKADYLPLVQPIKGTYNVNPKTMKAIYVKDAQTVLKALGRGQKTVKQMEIYIKKYSNAKMKSTKIHVERLKKAVEILKTVKGVENLISK